MRNDALNKIANVTFIVACVVLVTLAFTRARNDRPGASGAVENPIATGGSVSEIDGVSFSTAAVTVALVVHTECRFCTDSVPFYRRLSTLRADGAVRLIALSRESIERLSDYLRANDVHVDQVARLKGPEIQAAGTPILLLIDRKGTVRGSWLGRLNAAQEREVIARITRTSGKGAIPND